MFRIESLYCILLNKIKSNQIKSNTLLIKRAHYLCDRSFRNFTVETNAQICFAVTTHKNISKLSTFTLKHIIYASQMLIIIFKASADDANNTISST